MIILRTRTYSSNKDSRKKNKEKEEIFIPKEVLRHKRGYGRAAFLGGGIPGIAARYIVGDDVVDKISSGDRDYKKIKDDATKKAALISGLGNAAAGAIGGLPQAIGWGAAGAIGGALGGRKAASRSIELAEKYEDRHRKKLNIDFGKGFPFN